MSDTSDLEDFQWDLAAERHTRAKGLRPAIVHAVATSSPRVFANAEGKRGTHVMIGPDRRGRFWTIVMLRARNGRWRPITGWPSKRAEIALYRGDEG